MTTPEVQELRDDDLGCDWCGALDVDLHLCTGRPCPETGYADSDARLCAECIEAMRQHFLPPAVPSDEPCPF